VSRVRLATLLAAVLVAAAANAQPVPTHRKVAVLEFRGGVQQAAGLGNQLAERLKRTAALTVMGPVEARQRVPRIDAEVARCGGEGPCLSRIGEQIEVDEILLVGISKLGDVVLALQRIDVSSQKATNQLSEVLPADEGIDDRKLSGWLKQLYPPDVFKRYGSIVVTANVDGALVTINGQERGETPLEGPVKVLAPRGYRVDVTKPGFVPFVARIDVPPDAKVEVRAELSREQGQVPWYKRWWPWAIAGGLIAAAAVTVLVIELRPDMSTVMGSIGR
jgi:hypothetical protein